MSTTARQEAQVPKGAGAGSVVAIVLGSLVALLAILLLASGLALVGLHLFARDGGWYSSGARTVRSSGYAVSAEGLQIGDAGSATRVAEDINGSVRVRATAPGGRPVFVGIAPQADVARYLHGVAHDQVTDVRDSRIVYVHHPGSGAAPGPPGAQRFWTASAAGPGTRTARTSFHTGGWAAVVMNPDVSRGVRASVSVGARTNLLLWIGLGLLAVSLLVAAVATALLVGGLRARSPGPPAPRPQAAG